MGRIQFTGENADDVIKESQGLLKKVTLSDFDNEVVLIGRFKNNPDVLIERFKEITRNMNIKIEVVNNKGEGLKN